jgi:hypothetical protein
MKSFLTIFHRIRPGFTGTLVVILIESVRKSISGQSVGTTKKGER